MENRKLLYVGGISFLLRDRYLCISFHPASSSRVYSQLSRVSLYSKCVEACVSRSAEQWSTRARHFADIVDISFSGSLGNGQEEGRKTRDIILSRSASGIFFTSLLMLESFRVLEGCEAIIGLTHSTRFICDLSPTS